MIEKTTVPFLAHFQHFKTGPLSTIQYGRGVLDEKEQGIQGYSLDEKGEWS